MQNLPKRIQTCNANFTLQNPIIFTNVKECVPLFQKLNAKRILLVTDSFLRTSGITKPLEDFMKQNDIDCIVYDKTCPNPTVKNVEEAKQLYIENNCQGIIAFGGGSSMDCAKATGACMAYPNKTYSYSRYHKSRTKT